jgi:hypothetical protein
MAQHSTRLAVALASVLSVVTVTANAQESAKSRPAEPLVFGTGATYEVKFDDDPLGALPSDVIIPRITVRGSVGSPLLMRARTQFVVEMLKSVDTI